MVESATGSQSFSSADLPQAVPSYSRLPSIPGKKRTFELQLTVHVWMASLSVIVKRIVPKNTSSFESAYTGEPMMSRRASFQNGALFFMERSGGDSPYISSSYTPDFFQTRVFIANPTNDSTNSRVFG